MHSNDRISLWTINTNLKRRKSPNGINLVFVPGQNVVLELNEVAGDVLEVFSSGAQSFDDICTALKTEYEVDDETAFVEEVGQVLRRFADHNLIVLAVQ